MAIQRLVILIMNDVLKLASVVKRGGESAKKPLSRAKTVALLASNNSSRRRNGRTSRVRKVTSRTRD